MNLRKIFTLLLALLCVSTVSCTKADLPSADGDGASQHQSAEKITPAEYTSGALNYILEVSDGKRTVTLNVTRSEGVTEAVINSPESMSDISVIWDAGGMRIVPQNCEALTLTEESAAGMRAFFEAMAHKVTAAEKKMEGMYAFELSGYETELLLSSDGYPRLISLTRDGYTRHGEVSFPAESKVTS